MIISLTEVKAHLRVIHDLDDELIEVLIDASEDEAEQFINDSFIGLIDSSGDLPASLRFAVYLLVQSKYEATRAEDIPRLRSAAETLMHPYRIELGV